MAVECQQVHDALRRRDGADDPALAEHVAECPACEALWAGGPTLAEALDAEPSPVPLDALLQQVEQALARERGARAWLRSRPTWLRALLAAVGAGAVPLGVWLAWGRVDAAVYPTTRWWIDLAVLVVPIAVALGVVMRPLHRSRWPRWVEPVVVLLAMVAVLVGPAMVPAHHDHAASIVGGGADLWPRAAVCLVMGTVLGLPMVAWMVMLLRTGGPTRPVPLAAVAAGLVGVLAIFMHCPIVSAGHLLCGHATILLPFVGLALLGRRAR